MRTRLRESSGGGWRRAWAGLVHFRSMGVIGDIRRHFEPRIRDDRGELRAITVKLQQGRGASRTRFDPMVHRFARWPLGRVTRWNLLMGVSAIGLMIGLVVALIGWSTPLLGAGRTFAGVAMVGFAVGVYVIAVPRRRRGDRERLASAIVRFGVCPHCVYSLDGASVREDGCVLCPECGSAWRRDRIRRFSEHPQARDVERVGPAWRRGLGFLGGWRWTEDDREEAVPLFSRTLLATVDPEEDVEDRRRVAEELWERLSGEGAGLRWVVGVVAGLAIFSAGAAWQGFAIASMGIELSALDLVSVSLQVLFFVAIGAVIGAAIVLSDLGMSRHRVHRAMIQAGRCPCCGSRLDRVAEEDGCAPCGHCGAGWRMVGAAGARMDRLIQEEVL